MRTLRSPLIIILFLSSITIGLLIQIIISAEYTVLNPNFYLEQMEKHQLYDIPQNYVIQKIKTTTGEKPSEIINKSSINAVNTAFSSEWTKNQSNKLINNFLGYLKNERPDIDLELDFSKRKELLRNEITAQLDNYPAEDLAACGINASTTKELADDVVRKLYLPDRVNLAQLLNSNNPELKKVIDVFRSYYIYTSYFCYIIYGLIFILFLLIGRGTGLKWFGRSMVTAGILVVFAVSSSNTFIDEFIVKNISGQGNLLATIGTNPLLLATIIKNCIIGIVDRIGIAFSATGVIFMVTGFYWNRKYSKKTSSKQYKTV